MVSHPQTRPREWAADAATQTLSRRQLLRQALCVGICLPSILGAERAASGDELSAMQLTPSPAEQKQLGKQAVAQLLSKYKPVTDARATYFTNLGTRLVRALPARYQDWDFDFHVLDSPTVNAFSVPGGPMFMFTGLFKVLESEDAVAAVTGHEMAHVYLQHWARAYAKDRARQVIVDVTAILDPHHLTAYVLGKFVTDMMHRRYSRGEEDHADAGGLANMVNAGYNPNGMVQMFTDLGRVAGNGNDALGGVFLSDPPLTSTRIAHTRRRIAAYGANRRWPPLTPLNYAALVGKPA